MRWHRRRFHDRLTGGACATERRAAADPRQIFLFARIRIRGGGGFVARNGGALARRRAASDSRVSVNDLRCARRAVGSRFDFALRQDRRARQKQAERRRCRGWNLAGRDFRRGGERFPVPWWPISDALLGDHRVETADDGALEREFGFEGAGVAGGGEAAPEFHGFAWF